MRLEYRHGTRNGASHLLDQTWSMSVPNPARKDLVYIPEHETRAIVNCGL